LFACFHKLISKQQCLHAFRPAWGSFELIDASCCRGRFGGFLSGKKKGQLPCLANRAPMAASAD